MTGFIQPPSLDVRFDAAVPGVRQILVKPACEGRQLLGRWLVIAVSNS
jgi:hypothetical protein